MPIFLSIFTVFMFSLVAIEANLQLNLFSGFRQIAVVVVFLLIWFFRRGKRTTSIGYPLAIVALLLLLIFGAMASGTPIKNSVIGLFMTIEFALLFYLATLTRISIRDLRIFCFSFLLFLVVNTFFSLIGYLQNFPAAMREDVGVQGDAGFFASGLNIGIIILLGLSFGKKKQFYLLLASIFSIVIFLTAIKKSMLINIIIWFIWNFSQGKKRFFARFMLITIVCLIALTLSIGALQSNINENIAYIGDVGFKDHVRLIMYLASFQIALDFFPFGSGAGSFGSLASITNFFSPLYHIYGVSVAPTNTQEAVETGTHTLLDTYWPHILAEAGFIGAVTMLYLFLTPIVLSSKVLKSKMVPPQIKFCAFIALCIPLALLFEGFALYTPEAPSFLIFLGGITGYCYRVLRKYLKQGFYSIKTKV